MPDEQQGLIDPNKLNQMKLEILGLEQRNLNTGEKTTDAMVELIQQTIANIADRTC